MPVTADVKPLHHFGLWIDNSDATKQEMKLRGKISSGMKKRHIASGYRRSRSYSPVVVTALFRSYPIADMPTVSKPLRDP